MESQRSEDAALGLQQGSRDTVRRVTSEPTRERTYSWGDPMASVEAARTSSGIEVLRAMAAGELPAPPVVATLGFELESVEEGRVVFAVEPAEYHYNPIGSVHGGV
jgi:hypothetical protein